MPASSQTYFCQSPLSSELAIAQAKARPEGDEQMQGRTTAGPKPPKASPNRTRHKGLLNSKLLRDPETRTHIQTNMQANKQHNSNAEQDACRTNMSDPMPREARKEHTTYVRPFTCSDVCPYVRTSVRKDARSAYEGPGKTHACERTYVRTCRSRGLERSWQVFACGRVSACLSMSLSLPFLCLSLCLCLSLSLSLSPPSPFHPRCLSTYVRIGLGCRR